ncbi:hypothetical protein ZIOFF_061517 [Zingiber officinale]|uniref:WW domain-containing protein n=2 Tax=Zingiber officinale TaxID=94328 RepID=A0A8J5EZB0_ZINOF|nr:hypothetical protein ZIOFF_061517 [Zingiber officinale]
MEGFGAVTGGGDEEDKSKAAFAGHIEAGPGAITLRRSCGLILDTTLWIPKQESEEKSLNRNPKMRWKNGDRSIRWLPRAELLPSTTPYLAAFCFSIWKKSCSAMASTSACFIVFVRGFALVGGSSARAMAVAPNVETIAASLRSCSLGEGREGGRSPPLQAHLAEVSDESGGGGGISVELNSEIALPVQWEQCLDLRTGEIYYINWENGDRTTEDPRSTSGGYSSSNYYDDGDDGASDEYSSSRGGGGSGGDDKDASDEEDTADSSSLSSASPSPSSSVEDPIGEDHTLVAAGCKACFMYFMVPKRVDSCPKCAGGLLHLGRNG